MHLLDVNVLVALAHALHPSSSQGGTLVFYAPRPTRFASSSITEIGFVRVSVQTGLSPTVEHAKAILTAVLTTGKFIRLTDSLGADSLPSYVTKAKETTDGHLLALAKHHDAKLATLDTASPARN